MAGKKKTAKAVATGQQMDLLEVGPENQKEIMRVAKAYRSIVKQRVGLSAKENELKQKLLGLIKDAHLQRLEDGKIKFKLDGYLITVTPRDELVQIKEDSDAETA